MKSLTTEEIDHQWSLDQLHDFMQKRLRRRWCVNCEQTPRITMSEGTWVYLCKCGLDKTMLAEIPDIAKMRIGEMTITDIARRGVESIKAQDVRLFIAKDATDEEIDLFLKFCVFEGLNPFKNEVYFIPFMNSRTKKLEHAIITGIDTYRKRASRHPRYAGHQTGVMVTDSNGILCYREGEFMLRGDTLVGGWSDCYMTGAPRAFRHTVNLEKYDKRKNVWARDAALMIAKVAEGQGLRKHFPEAFEDMQGTGAHIVTDAEFDGDIPEAAVIEGSVVAASNVSQPSSAPKWCSVHDGANFSYEKHWVRGEQVSTWAHVVEGEEGPKGGKVWCELDNVGEAEPPQPVQDSPQEPQGDAPDPEPVAQDTEGDEQASMAFENKGALFTWAHGAYNISRDDVAQAAGYKNADSMPDSVDLAQAQQQVIALHGGQ